MDKLTKPFGETEPEKKFTHIYDWLASAPMSSDPGVRWAAFFLHHRTLNAATQNGFHEFLPTNFTLFCDYEGARYRCNGASRLGDVWLAKNHQQEHGYDLRVAVDVCSNWGRLA
jgi:hypothetical protein